MKIRMKTFNNLRTTEPAFIRHEKSARRFVNGSHKRLNDCCFSFSNLALIIASVLALIYSCKFLNDNSLYDYGEYLLSLRFYRQLVFIIVILPLILIVPLLNAISAFSLNDWPRFELGKWLMGVKLSYQVLLAVFVLIGLIFVAPSIRYGSVVDQIGYEIRRHMKLRYDNDFSYVFLDSIQEEYKCCDESWYLSNYHGDTPFTCYKQNGSYRDVYDQTCAEVLGSIVSFRCAIIAASLLIILIALGGLIVIDLLEILTFSTHHYNVGSQESRITDQPYGENQTNFKKPTEDELKFPRSTLTEDRMDLVDELSNRLNSSERLREIPLLTKSPSNDQQQTQLNGGQSPILTRANYLYKNRARPQSPYLISVDSSETPTKIESNPTQSNTKGVLKKAGSFQRVYPSDDDSDSDGDGLKDNQVQMKRDLQIRRSLLNVRFAN